MTFQGSPPSPPKKTPSGIAELQCVVLAQSSPSGAESLPHFPSGNNFACSSHFPCMDGEGKKKTRHSPWREIRRGATMVVSAHHNWASCQRRRAAEVGGRSLSSLLLNSAEKRSVRQINGILGGRNLNPNTPSPGRIIYLDS